MTCCLSVNSNCYPGIFSYYTYFQRNIRTERNYQKASFRLFGSMKDGMHLFIDPFDYAALYTGTDNRVRDLFLKFRIRAVTAQRKPLFFKNSFICSSSWIVCESVSIMAPDSGEVINLSKNFCINKRSPLFLHKK